LFSPASGRLDLASVFVQDQIALSSDFDLVLGVKIEHDGYSSAEAMPSIRATWRPDDQSMFWAAISRAVRSPTPFDADVVEMLGPVVFLVGNKNFSSEKLIAYELGYRTQLSSRASLSINVFDHEYDDLRSIELAPGGGLPLQWGNLLEGRIFGVEAWGNYQVADWWRLSAGLVVQDKELRVRPGSSGILGLTQAGDDPDHQATLKSSMDLDYGITVDANLRWVGHLPDPPVESYVEMNVRVGWQVSENLELSLSGSDFLHDRHREFTAPPSEDIEPGVFLEARWRF
jgi:iron complex outermembrane recepter protein